jgi:methyl-accepting chemotaxis protein
LTISSGSDSQVRPEEIVPMSTAPISARLRAALPRGIPLEPAAWSARHRVILWVLWVQVPMLLVIGLVRGYSPVHTVAETAPVIAFAVLGARLGIRELQTVATCIGLLLADAVLIHFTGGMIEAHFGFFVMVPLIALYQDLKAFVIAIGFVVVHHVGMTLIAPNSVFNHAAAQNKPLLWAGLHAAFVVALVAVVLVFWRFAEQTQIELADVMREVEARAATAEHQAHEARAAADRLEEMTAQLQHSAALAEDERRAALHEASRRQSVLDRAAGFERSLDQVVSVVDATSSHMEMSARALGELAEQTSRQAEAAALASEEVNAHVARVAAATDELNVCIADIGRQVAQSSSVAHRAAGDTRATNATVGGLAEAVGRIGPVVQLISGIASQTRLLALNATIEAARAGEAGKGFAVVANEVQTLANETARATDEIAHQIADIQHATREAVTAIDTIGTTVDELDAIAASVSSNVAQQAAAAQGIARSAQDAAVGTQRVTSGIGQVTRAASESSQASSEVIRATGDLAGQSSDLRTQVDGLLAAIRSA